MSNRTIQTLKKGTGQHWVGDGFHVNSMFSYSNDSNISPFLLLDYAGATHFPPSDAPRGVEKHPHRGFETVTIVYSGELEHSDTAGNKGKIGPGDVQWMTAARGILHEEKHSEAFTKKGGMLEMVQLWINLPAKDKMSAPGYQEILDKNIPVITIKDGVTVRIIAGQFASTKGPAKTFTPIHLYDLSLKQGSSLELEINADFNAMFLVLNGVISIGNQQVQANELAMLTKEGDGVALKAEQDSKLLFMAGEPIPEPVVGMGPFVMNTEEEIHQAYSDFRAGKF